MVYAHMQLGLQMAIQLSNYLNSLSLNEAYGIYFWIHKKFESLSRSMYIVSKYLDLELVPCIFWHEDSDLVLFNIIKAFSQLCWVNFI